MAFFEIQTLPKLISRKIEWQINSCIVDLNFTFRKFLEQSEMVVFEIIQHLLISRKNLMNDSKIHQIQHCEIPSVTFSAICLQ